MDSGSENYERYLSGDDHGMEQIIAEYAQGLIFYLSKILGSLEQAEEAAEDAFVLLCTKRPKNQQKSSFKTWLYTIGRNLAIDRLRRMARSKTLPLEECPEAAADDPEAAYLRDETKKTLNRAMKQLKPEYRQLLHLQYFEGLSHQEIARIMGKTVRATQMLATRARQALKEKLIQEGIDHENIR